MALPSNRSILSLGIIDFAFHRSFAYALVFIAWLGPDHRHRSLSLQLIIRMQNKLIIKCCSAAHHGVCPLIYGF